MTRKWFLGLLGIGAAGQQTKPLETHPIYTIQQQESHPLLLDWQIPKSVGPGGGIRPKPRNGECPVCGTMAKKYDRWDIGMMPPHELVRCTHCSAAFWQDAENPG